MPEITIQQSTFERLQLFARPLVDTTDTVIGRALDALDRIETKPTVGNGQPVERERRIDPRALPSLTHTKVLDATIDGDAISKSNWNSLLDEMLRRTTQRMNTFDQVRKYCPVNMVRGQKADEGYRYVPEIDISVQGQDANGACRAIVTAAQGLGISIEIGFMWRMKQAAEFPGQRARLQLPGTKT